MTYELVVYFPNVEKYETTYFHADEDIYDVLAEVLDALCEQNHTLTYKVVRIVAQENVEEED